MPQVIFRYNPNSVTPTEAYKLGLMTRRLIAEAASTSKIPFTIHDIEWITAPHGPGSIAPTVGLEIRTIGYPERKNKLNKEYLKKLKTKLLDGGYNKYVGKNQTLIWVQFVDLDGLHI